jgi:hypothetical protein
VKEQNLIVAYGVAAHKSHESIRGALVAYVRDRAHVPHVAVWPVRQKDTDGTMAEGVVRWRTLYDYWEDEPIFVETILNYAKNPIVNSLRRSLAPGAEKKEGA